DVYRRLVDVRESGPPWREDGDRRQDLPRRDRVRHERPADLLELLRGEPGTGAARELSETAADLREGAVQAEEDRHLEDDRQAARRGVEAALLVQVHLLFRVPLAGV